MKFVRNLMILMFVAFMSVHTVASAQQADVELIEPGPIGFPGTAAYTLNEVRKAVLSAAMRHDWRVESDEPGIARIILDGRTDGAVLEIDIIYDVKSYSIKYVRSAGLRYTEGIKPVAKSGAQHTQSYVSRFDQPRPSTIHPSYSRWMKNLTNSIDVELRIVKL